VLCPNCGPYIPDAMRISMETLRYLRHFQRSSFDRLTGIDLPAELNRDLELFLQNYFTYHLERGLNTPDFIRRVEKG
jgi:DNA repair protein RecO (recombination protein O)